MGENMRSPRGRERWLPTLILAFSFCALQTVANVLPADAQARRSETTFAVRGVPADDVLNIRDRPDGKQILGHVPPDGRGIVAIGPRTKATDGGTWIKIRFGDVSGWVNVRFIGPDTLQTASTASHAASSADLEGPDSKTPAKVFDGVWSHERWTLMVAPDQIELLAAGTAGPASRTLAAGSRDCGGVYERHFASLTVDEIPMTFTDPRFQSWAKDASRGRTIAVMVVTCGAVDHRYVFFLTDLRKMLVAEWNERAWGMFAEFVSDAQRIGRR
jgi:hypothetical protein